jgi:hypothetical protein
VRECGPRVQHNELAGSSGPKRASTSCDTPEWYYNNGRQRQRPDLPHIGGQKSVSRDHSADWPAAKARFADQPQIFVQRVTKDWTSPAHRACIPKASCGHN